MDDDGTKSTKKGKGSTSALSGTNISNMTTIVSIDVGAGYLGTCIFQRRDPNLTMNTERPLQYDLMYLNIDEFVHGSAAVQPVYEPEIPPNMKEDMQKRADAKAAKELTNTPTTTPLPLPSPPQPSGEGCPETKKKKRGKGNGGDGGGGKKKKKSGDGNNGNGEKKNAISIAQKQPTTIQLTEHEVSIRCAKLIRKYVTQDGAQMVIVETQVDESRRNKLIECVITATCIALDISCISVRASTKFQFRDPLIQAVCTRTLTRASAKRKGKTVPSKNSITASSPALKQASMDILQYIIDEYATCTIGEGDSPLPSPPPPPLIPTDLFYFDINTIKMLVGLQQKELCAWYRKEFSDCILQAIVTMNLMLPPPHMPNKPLLLDEDEDNYDSEDEGRSRPRAVPMVDNDGDDEYGHKKE